MSESVFSLSGKSILLTGGTAGLGRRFAGTLAAAGGPVAVVGRGPDLLETLVAEAPGCVAVPGDLATADGVHAVTEAARRAIGDPDILVNNAAYIAGGARAEDETL